MTIKETNKQITNNNVFIKDIAKLKNILVENLNSSSKALYYVNNNIMPLKIGNMKIGNDTIIFNTNHPYNCYSYKNNYCNNNRCYAKKYTDTYENSTLYNLACEIMFNKLSYKEIAKQINKKVKNEIKFIRINEAGDFKSIKDFIKLDNIIKEVNKNRKNKLICYTYTHNKELTEYLDIINSSEIVLNWSFENEKLKNSKKCIICFDAKQLAYYYNNKDYIICLGNCLHCPYCKDENDKRTVVFVDHYSKSFKEQLKAGLTDKQIKTLEINKFIDYANFLKAVA